MTLLIIRHAESVENADKYNGFYQDPRPYSGAAAHDISRNLVGLTPRGFRQAQWLAGARPDLVRHQPRVYTSTYRRAIDTAAIAPPSLPDGWPRQTPLLDEQHYGDATYMTKRELYDAYPELAEDRRQRKHIWTAPGGGESLATGVSHRAAEDLSLPEILAEERKAKLPNAAILHYDLHGDRFTRTGLSTPPPLQEQPVRPLFLNGPVQNGPFTFQDKPGKAVGIRLAAALNAILDTQPTPHLWNTVTLEGDSRHRAIHDGPLTRAAFETRLIATKYAPGPQPAAGTMTDADPEVAALSLEMIEDNLRAGTLVISRETVPTCRSCGHMTGRGGRACKACGSTETRDRTTRHLVAELAPAPARLHAWVQWLRRPQLWRAFGDHVLVMPSTTLEAMGLVALEAQACGLPVLYQPVPGLNESLAATGLATDFTNPVALARMQGPSLAATAPGGGEGGADGRPDRRSPARQLKAPGLGAHQGVRPGGALPARVPALPGCVKQGVIKGVLCSSSRSESCRRPAKRTSTVCRSTQHTSHASTPTSGPASICSPVTGSTSVSRTVNSLPWSPVSAHVRS